MEMENEEDKLMHEAEVATLESPSEPTVTKMRKRRNDFYIELALFLILGVLIGVALKNEAVKRVTMGFDDYKMKIFRQDYDLNAVQAKVIQQAKDAQAAADATSSNQTVPTGR
jgi:hypothetical protein